MHKRLSLEMGGKNAMIVLDDADLDLALDGVLWGAFGTTGQRCTATSRLIVQDGVHDEFVSRLVHRARSLKLGDGRKNGHRRRPADQSAMRSPRSSVTSTSGRRKAPICCVADAAPTGSGLDHGYLLRADDLRARPRWHASRAGGNLRTGALGDSRSHADEAFTVNNDVRYGLSSSVYTRDVNVAMRAMNELDNGHHVHQRPDDRRRGTSPVRRRKTNGEWPPRRRMGSVRVLLGDEGRLSGFLGCVAAGADRQLSRNAGLIDAGALAESVVGRYLTPASPAASAVSIG